MKWLDQIRSHCGIWHWYTRRKALRILGHAKFECVMHNDHDAVNLLTDKMFEVMKGTCAR